MQAELPLARATDPDTSAEAAQTVTPGNSDLIRAIRQVVRCYPCLTQFEIADRVIDRWGDRFSEATIRSACKRAGLERAEVDALSPSGNRCATWYLPTEDTPEL